MNDKVTHGMWSESESNSHINVLEIKAAMLGIQSLCQGVSHCYVRVDIDNTIAVSYINNMGAHNLKSAMKLRENFCFGAKVKIYRIQLVTYLVKPILKPTLAVGKSPSIRNGCWILKCFINYVQYCFLDCDSETCKWIT